MTQWGVHHRAPTASLAAVWCYGGGCEDPPPLTLAISIIRKSPTQSSFIRQTPHTAIGISRAAPDRPPSWAEPLHQHHHCAGPPSIPHWASPSPSKRVRCPPSISTAK